MLGMAGDNVERACRVLHSGVENTIHSLTLNPASITLHLIVLSVIVVVFRLFASSSSPPRYHPQESNRRIMSERVAEAQRIQAVKAVLRPEVFSPVVVGRHSARRVSLVDSDLASQAREGSLAFPGSLDGSLDADEAAAGLTTAHVMNSGMLANDVPATMLMDIPPMDRMMMKQNIESTARAVRQAAVASAYDSAASSVVPSSMLEQSDTLEQSTYERPRVREGSLLRGLRRPMAPMAPVAAAAPVYRYAERQQPQPVQQQPQSVLLESAEGGWGGNSVTDQLEMPKLDDPMP
jgi:hypothetical protein